MHSDKLKDFARITGEVLGQFGIKAVPRPDCFSPQSIFSRHEVLVIIGLAKDIRGSVIFNMSIETAKAIASGMMGGMPVNGMDDMTKSAMCEFANMTSGMTVSGFSGMFVDITPPTLVVGQKMAVSTGQEDFIVTEVITACGGIDVYLGVE